MMRIKLCAVLLLLLSFQAGAQTKKWSLQECIDYGVDHSFTMQKQELRNKNDRYDMQDAILDLVPHVNGISPGISWSYGRNIDQATNTYTNTNYRSIGGFGLNSSLNLFSGFSAVNLIRYRNVSRLRGLQQTELEANNIAVKVMGAFVNFAYAQGLVEIAEEQLDNAKMRARYIQEQYGLGMVSQSDVLEVQAQLANEEYTLVSNKNDAATQSVTLKNFMNYPLGDTLQIDVDALRSVLPLYAPVSVDEVFGKAKEVLPDVTVSAQNVRLNKLNLYRNKASLYPSLSLSGNLNSSYFDDRNEAFFSQLKNNLGKSFGFSVYIPIFSGLQKQTSVKRAKNDLKISEIGYQETLQTVYKEVQSAVQDLDASTQTYAAALKSEGFNNLSYKANQKKFEEGMINLIDLNTSSNNWLKAKNDLLKAKLDFVIKKRMVDFYNGVPLQVKVQE